MASNLQRAAELKEASLLVRYAAGCLNETERASVVGFAEGLTQETIANQLGCTQSAVAHATKTGFKKLRHQMERFLLTTQDAIDPSVFTAEGVRAGTRGEPADPLTQMLSDVNTGTRGAAKAETPGTWSIEVQTIRSVAK